MATTNKLSDKGIKAAIKAVIESQKSCRISDGAGLYLDIRPTGSAWWRQRYWKDGREGMLSLGTFPDVSLSSAREKRDESRKAKADGIDLSKRREDEKIERVKSREAAVLAAAGLPGPGTFENVAREWLATVHKAKVSIGHAERTKIRLEKMIFPWLGRRPISEIESPEVLECLRRIEARGSLETAHRVKDSCGQVFRFGVSIGKCQRDAAADLKDALIPVPTRHFAAIVDPKQAAALLRDMAGYQGNPITCAALQLSPLLLLRPGELRHLEWTWIDFDTAIITVPGEVMKRKKQEKADGGPHLVPLPTQAVAILKELHPITGHGRYVFPSILTGERCMSDNTVRSALRRLGYGNDEMTAHGFRAMARTMLAERLDVATEVIEAQLAHAVKDANGRAYNRTTFLQHRTSMMQRWADYLDKLRDGADILQFTAA